MDSHEPGHPAPSEMTALAPDTLVRDVATGEVRTVDAWVAQHMEREKRERQECLDEIVNAVARGDLRVE